MRKIVLTVTYALFAFATPSAVDRSHLPNSKLRVQSALVLVGVEGTYSKSAMIVHFLLSDSGKTSDLDP
jgi:hypothetical protein